MQSAGSPCNSSMLSRPRKASCYVCLPLLIKDYVTESAEDEARLGDVQLHLYSLPEAL